MKTSASFNAMARQYMILDWDDTLVPSSCINKTNGKDCELVIADSELQKAGRAAFNFLINIFSKFPVTNIKIVTNSAKGWVAASLAMLSELCPIYKKIEELLKSKEIEIIHARDDSVCHHYWKSECFNRLLWRLMRESGSNKTSTSKSDGISIITMGDQWTDHESVEQSLAFSLYGRGITHHQIKFFPDPDPRYLSVELNYIAELIKEDVFSQFDDAEGILLEFEGYDDEK